MKRDLISLQSTKAGRHLLEQENVFGDSDQFLRHLRPTRARDQARPANELPVYVHQQVYLDYRPSVVAKIKALRELCREAPQIRPEFIWIDTDRAASDKLGLRLYLPGRDGRVPVRLAPGNCERLEPRFIRLDPTRIREATRRMAALIRQWPGSPRSALQHFERMQPLFEAQGSLADLCRGIADFLFTETMAFRPRPVLVSDLVASGALNAPIETLLGRQKDFVSAFNSRLRELRSLDIDPKVKPLPDDYLPLFMSCPVDRRRLRLRLGEGGHAWVKDSGGREHRFDLGHSTPSLEDLDRRARWGPDVTLPIMLGGATAAWSPE